MISSGRIADFIKKPRVNLVLEITVRCAARCNLCARRTMVFPKHQDMPNQVFDKILTDLHDAEQSRILQQVILGGYGEPTLYPQLEFLTKKLATTLSLPIKININGAFVTEKRIDGLLQSPIDSIVFSLNAVDADTFDKIMQPGLFEQALKRLEYLVHQRNILNRPVQLVLQLMNPWQKPEHEQLTAIKKLLRQNHDKVVLRELQNIVDPHKLTAVPFRQNTLMKPCIYLWNTLTVDPDGRIYFCCANSLILRDKAALCVGHILKQDLKDFLGNKYRQKFQDMMLAGHINEIRECAQCNAPVLL